MNEVLLSQKENKYSWDYLKNINQRKVAENSFMEGQRECANHSNQIIADLMVRLSFLESKLKEK